MKEKLLAFCGRFMASEYRDGYLALMLGFLMAVVGKIFGL
jgi:hypothetical protein